MNKLQMKGSWNELKGKLKQQFKRNCLEGFKRSLERIKTKFGK
jgi:hypothetical protein